MFGPKFKELLNEEFDIKTLDMYPLLMLEKSSNTRNLLDEYAKANNLTLTPRIELDSADLLIKFAKINLGIAFVIKEFAEPMIDNKTLFSRNLLPAIPHRAIGMVKLKNIPLSHAANGFVKLVLSPGDY